MARAVFQHELSDPDFTWLLTTFQERHPEYFTVDGSALPITLVKGVLPTPASNLPIPPTLGSPVNEGTPGGVIPQE